MSNALNEKWFVSDDSGGLNIIAESNVIVIGTNTKATRAIVEKIVADHNRLIALEDAARKASNCLPHWTKERGRIAKHILDVALKGEVSEPEKPENYRSPIGDYIGELEKAIAPFARIPIDHISHKDVPMFEVNGVSFSANDVLAAKTTTRRK